MLPLSIFFSDEFRLLSRQQLFKSVRQYFLIDDDTLVETWRLLPSGVPAPESDHGNLEVSLDLDLPLTGADANQRFSRYLSYCEQQQTHDILINPQQLHPRFEPLKRDRIYEGLCQRLHALAVTARDCGHRLFIQPPNEETLELTLELIADTLAQTDLHQWHGLGLDLHTSNKRCLPVLGWLEHLGRELQMQIPIRLTVGAPPPTAIRRAQQAGYSHYPVLTRPEHANIGRDLCHYFLKSLNSQCLQPCWRSEDCAPDGFQPPPLPAEIFLPVRRNVTGTPPSQLLSDQVLLEAITACRQGTLDAAPLVEGGSLTSEPGQERVLPSDARRAIGYLHATSEEHIRLAFEAAGTDQPIWNRVPIEQRAEVLQRWAQRLQQEQVMLLATCSGETGLSIRDALTDLRTGINLCYYYCNQARSKLLPRTLHGYAYEQNRMEYHGRGIYVCLTDHNEPFATLIGQLSALLVTGNAVLLQPDTRTASCAMRLIECLLESGLPSGVVAMLPGHEENIARTLLEDYRVAGCVCFLDPGRAAAMNALLGNRTGAPVVPLLSHSSIPGTQIVTRPLSTLDVRDILHSAFSHAGQKRTTLGTLYLEASVADVIEQQLADAMHQLVLGDPEQPDTDIGPLSRRELMEQCYEHIERFRQRNQVLAQLALDTRHDHGFHVPPTLLRLYTPDELPIGLSGPVLHLIRFEREDLPRVLNEINRYCPGQACSLYSEDGELIAQAEDGLLASRLLINRPLADTTASIHPAGSSGISGTGPLYGGPNYLQALIRERATTRRH
ncbi:proline dehydrogenase family protein [Marinobacterium weihaiense]|uniref:Proline dehydrogenase family protein n=1 Tax=Marinobacterium weihaiense TaxID=2851016 RepID=A0ABS6M7H6_9GAMM|nr:proline dehydrogenase family protein [Marinobacterium weihaiense]MBV0932233.1 proline dehydrogenase family protein [Marinobacterium weihaiense]